MKKENKEKLLYLIFPCLIIIFGTLLAIFLPIFYKFVPPPDIIGQYSIPFDSGQLFLKLKQ